MKLSKQINRSKKKKSKEINRLFFAKIQRNIPLYSDTLISASRYRTPFVLPLNSIIRIIKYGKM